MSDSSTRKRNLITDAYLEARKSGTPSQSLEVFAPRTPEGIAGLKEKLILMSKLEPKPLWIDCTCSVSMEAIYKTIDICAYIQNVVGVPALAHLTCCTLDMHRMDDILERLLEVGVRNIMCLRGDNPVSAGTESGKQDVFVNAAAMVRYVREKYGKKTFVIGVAGYPECHPESKSAEADTNWLVEKLEAGADFVFTQAFFRTEFYADFLKRAGADMKDGVIHKIRVNGADRVVNVPVIPGILALGSLTTYNKVTSLCKIAAPHNFPFDSSKSAADVKEDGKEWFVKFSTDFTVDLLKQKLTSHVHLYTLNSLEVAEKMLEGVTGYIRTSHTQTSQTQNGQSKGASSPIHASSPSSAGASSKKLNGSVSPLATGSPLAVSSPKVKVVSS